MKAVINARLITMSETYGIIENGYILYDNHKISKIGGMSGFSASESDFKIVSENIIDAGGKIVTPGLVDAHSHIGMWEDSLSFEGDDGNEDTDPITPQLRAIDAVNPFDKAFKEAFDAGITSVVTGPGSANPIGGQLAAIKTYGKRIDNMTIKAPCAVKAAFGENPKSTYNDKSQTPVTRMATASLIREALFKAREYARELSEYKENPDENDPPEFDIKCESLFPVLNKEIPIHAHAHRADDIFTAVRIAKEFDIGLVLVHCTEGHLIADELKCEGLSVLSGPILTDRSKPELRNQTEQNPRILNDAGLDISIITDHPETPEKYLTLCAAIAVKNGLDKTAALKAITINPARACGIDNRVGSLDIGKDSDIVIWDGDPLDPMSSPYMVLV